MSAQINSLSDLKQWVERFLAQYPQGAVVGLCGNLGAGKTTLVRTVIEVLCSRKKITPPAVRSPSFVLHQSYPEINPPIEHFDFYRLENIPSHELAVMGYEQAVERARTKKGFVFIEWPEKVADQDSLMMDLTLTLVLEHGQRRILSSRM